VTMSGAPASGTGSREPSPAVSAASGFDPSRFDNAKLAHVTARLLSLVTNKSSSLASGMWNPRFCAADARSDGLDFFDSLLGEIEHWTKVIRDSDGSPKGGDACGSVRSTTARAEGIAQTPSEDAQP
jgi:hypothetical protein